jgi:AP-1-like transcription factor
MESQPSADGIWQREEHAAQSAQANPSALPQLRMAAHQHDDDSAPYLSSNQQNLLLAALNAQAKDRQATLAQAGFPGLRTSTSDRNPSAVKTEETGNMSGNALFMSPQNAELDSLDYTPELDYLDGDDSFDFDNADLGGEMIGALPGEEHLNGHEKRKSPDDKDASEEADPKRHETQDGTEKGAKKPGRKPLTSEPTTVRLRHASTFEVPY